MFLTSGGIWAVLHALAVFRGMHQPVIAERAQHHDPVLQPEVLTLGELQLGPLAVEHQQQQANIRRLLPSIVLAL